MRKQAIVAVLALLCATGAFGQATETPTSTPTETPTSTNTQTHTPTDTPTPTNTPTFPALASGVFEEDGSPMRTCASAPCYSDWMEMPKKPVFEFELISGTATWKLWCRNTNSYPHDGIQMTFDTGATTVAADAIVTLTGQPNAATPIPDRSFVKYCRLEYDACSSCNGLVRFATQGTR